MTSQTTFYFSQLTGRRFISPHGSVLGRIHDLLIDLTPWSANVGEPVRPRVIAVQVKTYGGLKTYDFSSFEVTRVKGRFRVQCHDVIELNISNFSNCLWLRASILDRQIVDINDKKLVKVHDIRLVMIPSGTFALAVDVGPEGWLRRLGLNKTAEALLRRLGRSMPDDMILWDDIAALDHDQPGLKLSKSKSKLHTLHPSDLADIIEDLDKSTRTYVFAQLDEEQAADVLEEMETEAQIHLVASLPKEKVADVLEKMPADEVADILDELGDAKAEELLQEMERESSEEVRELLEYPDKVVGSIMNTDYMTFRENMTVEEVLNTIRLEKPEPSYIYSLFVVDHKDRLLSAIPLGELVVADPMLRLTEIMKKNPTTVFDDDGIDSLAELVSKYNLLAVPVINRDQQMEGVVVVEDIVDDLLGKRKTK